MQRISSLRYLNYHLHQNTDCVLCPQQLRRQSMAPHRWRLAFPPGQAVVLLQAHWPLCSLPSPTPSGKPLPALWSASLGILWMKSIYIQPTLRKLQTFRGCEPAYFSEGLKSSSLIKPCHQLYFFFCFYKENPHFSILEYFSILQYFYYFQDGDHKLDVKLIWHKESLQVPLSKRELGMGRHWLWFLQNWMGRY